MPYLGRLIDRFGPRLIMAAVAASFGAILIAGSAAGEIIGLTAAFIGIRVGGQGALGLVATTTVAVYVHRRRGFAIGVSSAIGTAGISLAPMLLERLVATSDWRTVRVWEGVAVWLLVIPAALLLLPRRPPERGAVPDPGAESSAQHRGALPFVDWTLAQAARTGMFWVVTGGVALRHLGAIRGLVHSVGVGASAFGPLLVALGRDHATSYRPILFALTVLPLAVVLAAVLVRTPPPAPPAREARRRRTTSDLALSARAQPPYRMITPLIAVMATRQQLSRKARPR